MVITIEKKQEIRESLITYVAQNKGKGISYAMIARDLKINAAYLSNISNGKFFLPNGTDENSDIKDDIFRKIANYVGYKLTHEYWRRCLTAESVTIEAAIDESKEYSTIKTIIGDTGMGKTFTIDYYATQNKHSNVYRVTVGQLHTVTDIIDELLDEMGLAIRGRSKVKKLMLMRKFLSDLKMKGLHPVIVIDEAENIRLPVLGLFKQVYDAIKGFCGMFLIGTNQLIEKIEKMKLSNKVGVAQFARRIKAGTEYLRRREWYKDKAIMAYLNEIIDDRRIIELLKVIAENYGEVNDYVEPSIRDAERLGEPFNYEFFTTRYRLNIA